MNIVSDPSANADEKIERAARVLRASRQNEEVFIAIYTGSKRYKTVEDLRGSVKNFNKNTYKAAARLHGEDIVDRKKEGGIVKYGKKDFYIHHRQRILTLSKNKERLKKYPTKRKGSNGAIAQNYFLRSKAQAQLITVDDIDSFKLVRKVGRVDHSALKKLPEREVNRAICSIVNQSEKKDWAGERNDIYTNKVVYKGKRKPAAFALKGKATQGILTLDKLGARADQVQRLFEGTAEVHFIVYHGDIDERVIDQMQIQAISKSNTTGKTIYFCPIDGKDLARLKVAYARFF